MRDVFINNNNNFIKNRIFLLLHLYINNNNKGEKE